MEFLTERPSSVGQAQQLAENTAEWTGQQSWQNPSQNENLGWLARRTPRFLREAKAIFKEKGFRGVIQRFGWKLFAALFVYYLVRDVTLYILLPWYLASKLL